MPAVIRPETSEANRCFLSLELAPLVCQFHLTASAKLDHSKGILQPLPLGETAGEWPSANLIGSPPLAEIAITCCFGPPPGRLSGFGYGPSPFSRSPPSTYTTVSPRGSQVSSPISSPSSPKYDVTGRALYRPSGDRSAIQMFRLPRKLKTHASLLRAAEATKSGRKRSAEYLVNGEL